MESISVQINYTDLADIILRGEFFGKWNTVGEKVGFVRRPRAFIVIPEEIVIAIVRRNWCNRAVMLNHREKSGRDLLRFRFLIPEFAISNWFCRRSCSYFPLRKI
jgi:hypothetical protein